jgi:hypothetical protein
MFARVPGQGGLVWVAVQWVLGLRRLGHDVVLIEPLETADLVPAGSSLARSDNARYFRHSLKRFGLSDVSALLLCGTRQTVGVTYEQVRRRAREADLLINLAGGLRDPELLERIPRRLYVDLDPGFTQLWHTAEGIDMRFAGHTHFATVGLALQHTCCRVPRCGIDWIVTCQPVVLDEWPFADEIERDALTSVANWRGYGSIDAGGVFYGQKAHSVRALIDLPRRTGRRFELALSIDPGEPRDIEALADNGWSIVDPRRLTHTPHAYRQFIQGSRGELGVAKSGYVKSRCGWFSDRSACYLASGRPVLAQETGFSATLPVGAGLFAFEDPGDIEVALDELDRRYDDHRRAARALAEQYFHSDIVLTRLLDHIGGVA